MDLTIERQAQFVEWLKERGMYNPMDSTVTMQKMHRVWKESSRLPAGWISADERLPTHHHSVLGYVVGGGLAMTDPMIDIVSYVGKDDPRWLQFMGEAGDAEVAVSHWKPLPDEPAR